MSQGLRKREAGLHEGEVCTHALQYRAHACIYFPAEFQRPSSAGDLPLYKTFRYAHVVNLQVLYMFVECVGTSRSVGKDVLPTLLQKNRGEEGLEDYSAVE